MKKYLVVDIGTSSVRAAVVDEKLQIRKTETIRRTAGVCFDAEQEWKTICVLIKKLTRTEKQFAGAAVSSLLGWVGIDRNGNAVTPCYSYMHQENEVCEAFRKSKSDEEVCQICGRKINPEWAAFKMCTLKKRQPDKYRNMAYMISMKDFINRKLTGRTALDRTSAGYTMLYDIRKETWSSGLLEALELDREKLPELKYPYERLGEIREELLLEFGIHGKIPVAVGSVDGSTAILGAGGIKERTAVSVMGTTDVFFMVTREWKADSTQRLIVNPHVIPGLWLVGGPMGMYGGTIEWFLKHIMNQSMDIQEMNHRAAALETGSGGVQFYPNLAGERTPFWNPLFTGTVTGMRQEHRAEHLFRAIMEASGYTMKRIMEIGAASDIGFDEVTAIGGGAKSSLWLQIKADIMGKIFWSAEAEEATVTGSVLLAMLAEGKRPEELPAVPKKECYFCRQEIFEEYEKHYERYIRSHEILQKLYQ